MEPAGATSLAKGGGFLSTAARRWLGQRGFTGMCCQSMDSMTWPPRLGNCKACRSWDDMHADVSLKRRALPHNSGCSLFQEAVYHTTRRKLVGISFISHSFQSWILFHSCYLQSKPVNLSQQYNYDIKINYRKFQEEKASFFQRKLLKATISNPSFSQAITKEGAPSCNGLTHAQTRRFTLVYMFSCIDCVYRRGSYQSWIGVSRTWISVQRNHCSYKHGLTQRNVHLQGKIICHQLAGKAGFSVMACIAMAGGRPFRTDCLPPPRSQQADATRCGILGCVYSSSYTASPHSLMQLLLLLGMFCFRVKPQHGLCEMMYVQELLNHENPQS